MGLSILLGGCLLLLFLTFLVGLKLVSQLDEIAGLLKQAKEEESTKD